MWKEALRIALAFSRLTELFLHNGYLKAKVLNSELDKLSARSRCLLHRNPKVRFFYGRRWPTDIGDVETVSAVQLEYVTLHVSRGLGISRISEH